ncbi:AI-2E family transporter [soil metagenome]
MSKTTLDRFNSFLLATLLTIAILYFGQNYLIPIFIAALLSMLLLPICEALEKLGTPPKGAITISVMLALTGLTGLLILMTNQITNLVNDLPELRRGAAERIQEIQILVEDAFNISYDDQSQYVNEIISDVVDSIGLYARNLIITTTSYFAIIMIIMVYIFLFLLYRNKFVNFILKLAPPENHRNVSRIINKTTKVAHSYLGGVLTVVLILAILNTTGLLIIGVRHAVFFGLLAAILNIIPYVGTIIGSIIPVIFAFFTNSILTAVAVAILFTVIQLIESYLLTPNITGSRIKINPLATIMALLAGGAIWGIAGMVLFIPLLGILRVLFENLEGMQPYAYLIRDEQIPDNGNFWTRMKIFFKREGKIK